MLMMIAVRGGGRIVQTTTVGLPKRFDERLTHLTGDTAMGAGVLVSLVYLVSAVGQMAGGLLADRFSLKWVYLLSQIAQVPILLIAFSTHNTLLVAAAALMVTFNVGGQPAENALLAGYTPRHWRGRIYGIKGVLTLGLSAAGVALVPVIHEATGSLDLLFLALAGFAALAAVATLALPPIEAAAAAHERNRTT